LDLDLDLVQPHERRNQKEITKMRPLKLMLGLRNVSLDRPFCRDRLAHLARLLTTHHPLTSAVPWHLERNRPTSDQADL
jgi:hypothetical protein